jgi:hypothetical protein
MYQYKVGAPFERIAMDNAGPFQQSDRGNRHLSIAMDYFTKCRLGVLATGLKVCGLEPGQGHGFLRAIKIRSTPSSRMGSKAGRSHIVTFFFAEYLCFNTEPSWIEPPNTSQYYAVICPECWKNPWKLSQCRVMSLRFKLRVSRKASKCSNHSATISGLWVVTLYSFVVGYHSFGGTCCFNLQSRTSVVWRWWRQVTPRSLVVCYQNFGGYCCFHLHVRSSLQG